MSIVFSAFIVALVLNFYWFLMAALNLAPGHLDAQSVLKVLFWSKLSTDRDYFTDVGWQYRSRAVRASYVVIVLVVLLVLFGRE